MTALFAIENQSGSILIDDRTPNIHMVAKGQHSTATDSSPAPIGTRSTLTLSATMPILAFKPVSPNIGACLLRVSPSNGQWRFFFLAQGSAGELIDWWLFDTVIPQSDLFEIYDEAGVRTFSMGTRPFKPVASFVGDGTDDVSMPAPDGAVYAVVQGAVSGQRRWDVGANGNRMKYWEQSRWDAVHRNGAGVTVRRTLLDRATSPVRDDPGPTIEFTPRNLLVVNVANL